MFRAAISWNEMYHYGWDEPNLFVDLVKSVKDKVRIMVAVGDIDSHLGLAEAVDTIGKKG